MADPTLAVLSEWQNFYVIAGSSAAGLTGLMFVVIALQAGRGGASLVEGTRAFGSPTVVHFSEVLLLSAVCSVPRHTPATLAACLFAAGLLGMGLTAWAAVLGRRQRAYRPVLSDWLWHLAAPAAAYALLLVAAAVAVRHAPVGLDLVAAAALGLLFTGIHNAWDAAVWIAAGR